MERMPLESTVCAQFCLSGEKICKKSETVSVTKLPFELFIASDEGGFSLRSGGEKYEISEGCVALVPYDTEYTLHMQSGTHIIYAALQLCVYSNLRVFSLYELKKVFDGDTGNEIVNAFRELCSLSGEREFTNSRLENAVKIKSDVYRLCSLALEGALPKSTRGDIMTRHEKLAPVLEYIHNHIRENIMQSELSGLLKMSPDAFYRLFRQLIGSSPKDFIISEKLRAAREMLVMTDMPIGEISKIMGYDNQLYFSALFKKKYGVCPTEYKKATAKII